MKAMLERLISDRFAVWAVPSLLLLVATFHFVMVKTTNLTQWKGAGFGMFTTTDNATNRWIRAYGVEREGDVYPLDVPKSLWLHERRARSQTLERRVRYLGDRMLAMSWSVNKDGKATTKKGARPLDLEAIQLEMWTAHYVSEGPRIDAEMLFKMMVYADE